MHVVSVATGATWAQARVMARSLRRFHPDWPVTVVFVGAVGHAATVDDDFDVMSVEDALGLRAAELLAGYEPAELLTLLVPRVLRARAERVGGPVLHVSASACVLGELKPFAAALDESSVVLVPRAHADPPDDGLEPTERQLAKVGRISAELMAIDGSSRSGRFLAWWIHRLDNIMGSPDGRSPGHLAENRHLGYLSLGLAPTLFSATTLEDPGCNVSFWNLHEHAIEESSSGLILDGRTRLRLFDFSGFEAEEPYRLSPISSRIRVSRSPLLKALCERYTHELLDAGWLVGRHRPDVGRRLANGIVFDEALERLHAEAQMLDCDFGDVFSADGTTAFMAWLKGPASQGAEHGINRYVLHRVLRERQDVRAAFPDLDGRDGPAFVRWCHNFGVREMGFPRELLPAQAPSPAEPSGSRAGREWRSPDGRGPRVRRAAVRAAAGSALGVRVTGYMGHVLGLGSAARGYASALAAAGVPVSTVAVGLDHLDAPVLRESGYGRHSHQDVLAEGGHAFELVCVNPDELLGYIKPLGDDYFRGRRIGVWGWEVNSIPARWARAYSFVDEIWVYSRFVAENLGAVAPVPVVALPPPVNPPDERVRSRLGVPDGFLFLFVFDYMSTIQRKNPIGLIDAFKRAFAPGEGPRLLIKTINAPLRPLHEEAILWAAEGRADIHVIDRSLPPEEKDALMAGCDCYVSLHRSEGFGLTMAEAMAIGKPVIATAYSGNVDFMNPQNSLLVDYELTRVGAGVEIYPAEAEWADPDLDQAAALMRQVYEDPERARALGARAREDIVRTLSPQTTGAAMRARLEELAARPERPSLQRFVKRLRQLT